MNPRLWFAAGGSLAIAVALHFLLPPSAGPKCQALAERCAVHAHEREPVSLGFHDTKRFCPCDDFVANGCLRAPASVEGPSRVEQACAQVGLPPVRLSLHDEQRNIALIKALGPGPNPFAAHLRQFYNRKTRPTDTAALLAIANIANEQFLKDTDLKAAALKFSSSESRQSNPEAYLVAFLRAAREASPRLKNNIDAFLSFRHPLVKKNVIRVAEKAEFKELSGQYRTKDSGDGKTAIREITLSTDTSASFPNQFTTLFHELVHAENFEPHLLVDPASPAYAEAELMDEAKAYEAQMAFYLDLTIVNPELFCNWLHVTNRYGNLIIPLGWMMAAVERELTSGQFMAREAARINYRDHDLLFDGAGGVRPDLRARMQSLGFQYAR